jgi:hypothetical protein
MAPKAYTALVLTFEGQIIRRVHLRCETEGQAEEQAKQLVDIHPVELWQGPRRIARFRPT